MLIRCEASLFKTLIGTLKDFASFAMLNCNESGLVMAAEYSETEDSEAGPLLTLHIPKGEFQTFKHKNNVTLGLCIDTLSEILQHVSCKNTLTLELTEYPSDTLSLLWHANNNSRVSRFDLRLMDIGSRRLRDLSSDTSSESQIPDIASQCFTVMISASEFQRICKQGSGVGKTVTLSVTNGKDAQAVLVFSVQGSRGTLTTQVEVRITLPEPKSDLVVKDVKKAKVIKEGFSMVSLISVTKAAVVSKQAQVTLKIFPNRGLLVECGIGGSKGSARFYLSSLATVPDED